MILDTKASNVKHCSAKFQRVLLPRILDAILKAMHLLDCCESGEEVDFFVLDYTDAYWQVPLDPAEREYFCCQISVEGKTKYIVFLRMVQGCRSAPLCWARLAALLMRLTQSLFEPNRVNLHCFVDDPVASIRGTKQDRRLYVATMIYTWEA